MDRRDFEEEPNQEEEEEDCSSLDEMKRAMHLLDEDSLVEEQIALCTHYHQTLYMKGDTSRVFELRL